ncbi:undecaprenyl-diphosphatase [Luteibacter sp. OK325]|jgi:undecaprenyl-diphosphatase|uniref:phosphatase PAP2 family protein n=1 Tax=Luteibacter sp. OK325 TaxID=2135670 RepID=UPI000D3A0EBA|nr:phosphatase PAP2 family protein [Luteibacter sp. OK325]PTR23967.1 undecaprenyl-diphosphatase [Luteibacter sp. OK325]
MALRTWACLCALAVSAPAFAGGGPLGIDHRLHYDNSGIWKRSNQKILATGTAVTIIGGALLLGDNDEFGDTLWRSVDSVVLASATTDVLKLGFRRQRPSETDDPDKFFSSGKKNNSFPSGEVTLISAAVTPFIVHYGEDHPMVYALALLPAYDMVARMKTRGHWQTDVLAGAAIGTGFGIWASHRNSPFILSLLPGGFQVGFIKHFD